MKQVKFKNIFFTCCPCIHICFNTPKIHVQHKSDKKTKLYNYFAETQKQSQDPVIIQQTRAFFAAVYLF